MLMPLMMSMQGINYAHQGASLMFGGMDTSMALASRVTGNESPMDVARLAQMDKAIALQGAYAQTLYFAGQAMQEAGAKMQQKETEHRQKMLDAGVLFF